MPGVFESAVIGVPHADFGEGVAAVVVCARAPTISEDLGAEGARPARQVQAAEARRHRRRAARNTMGKVQKNVLRDTYAKIYAK